VPGGAAKLTVGGRLKTESFLESDDVSNGAIFYLPKSVGVNLLFGEGSTSFE